MSIPMFNLNNIQHVVLCDKWESTANGYKWNLIQREFLKLKDDAFSILKIVKKPLL